VPLIDQRSVNRLSEPSSAAKADVAGAAAERGMRSLQLQEELEASRQDRAAGQPPAGEAASTSGRQAPNASQQVRPSLQSQHRNCQAPLHVQKQIQLLHAGV
jgi:hypothetical protein